MKDPAHQYEAEGMMHHNCIPTTSFIELDNKVVRLKDNFGQRLSARDRTVIPVHTGTERLLKVIFRSRDFSICDHNHKFIYGKKDSPMVQHLYHPQHKCWMAPMRKRMPVYHLLSQLFKKTGNITYLLALVNKDPEISNNNPHIAFIFLKHALMRNVFEINDVTTAASLRSLANLYGYNLKTIRGKYYISFFRVKKSKIKSIAVTDKIAEVGTTTVITKHQMYEAQGVWNKNTGGDVIRIVLCKFFDLINKKRRV